MSKKITGCLFVLLLIATTVIGSYFLYQYKSKQIVISLIEQLAPVADISYSELAVNLEGKVSLVGVRFSPIGYQDAILIDKIDLISGGAAALIDADQWFKGSLPENLELQLKSVIFKVDSDFLTKSHNVDNSRVVKKTLWGMACVDSTDFSSLAKQLGLLKLQANVNIELSSDSSSRVFNTVLAAEVPGLAKAEFSVEVNSQVPFEFYDRAVLSRARIAHASAKMIDMGFNLKRIRHCAKQENIQEKHYPDFYNTTVRLNMVGEEVTELPELDESVLAFFQPKSKVSLQFTPKYPLYLPEVFGHEFSLFNAPGLALSVNNQSVSTNYLPLLKGIDGTDFEKAAVKEEILSEIKAAVVEAKEIKSKSMYRLVNFTELNGMQGVKIRLKTKVGKELDGVLLRIEADKLVMQRRVEQGMVTYPVDRDNIASIKVPR